MEGDKITTISFLLSLAVRILLDENENIHSHYLINGKNLLCSFVLKCEELHLEITSPFTRWLVYFIWEEDSYFPKIHFDDFVIRLRKLFASS